MPPLSAVAAAAHLFTKTTVTYIRVARPQVDIVHLVLGAFSVTAVLAVSALVLGVAFAVTLILKRRREAPYHPTGLDLSQQRND